VARTELDDCVERALEALAGRLEATHAHIRRDVLPTLSVDRTLVTQVYQNLIGNALKFNDQDIAQIHLTAQVENGETVLGVKDGGICIKEDYAQQIFAPFKRLHGRGEYEGSGIGLSICRKAVECHGGKI
jgi:light-regulated signal transduction histidine kinase (bacteriophytochrome)